MIIFFISLPLSLSMTVQQLKYYARVLFSLSGLVFLLVLIGAFLEEKNDIRSDGATKFCVDNIYILNTVNSQMINLYILSTLNQIPTLSAQYNLDTFLIQFQTKIRSRESSDVETLKSCIIALCMAFVFYMTMNIVSTHMVLRHSFIGGEVLVTQITIYESLLLWPTPIISVSLTILFFVMSIINVIFTSFIAYE